MMQGSLDELALWGVYDRGVPNNERVVIRVAEHVDMASYALVTGTHSLSGNGGVIPLANNFFWFGNGVLKPGDWIFVYSSPGAARVVDHEGTDDKMYVLHWGKTQTIFHVPTIVPILFRMDAFASTPVIPPPPAVARSDAYAGLLK